MHDPAPSFGAQVRRYRLRAGLSQEALAARGGLSTAAVSALERGVRRRPQPDTVRRLAAVLALSGEELAAFAACVSPANGAHAAEAAAPLAVPHANVPAPRTLLVGRDGDVAALRELAMRTGTRLLTLTGVGGGGKTRLAMAVAEELAGEFAGGVCWVPLAAVEDPALVPQAVADALGAIESPGTPPLEAVAGRLDSRGTLLVLDNCEQVLDGCLQLVEHLLSTCPTVSVLATSREPLLVAGEQQWRVSPLPVPEEGETVAVDDLARSPAVQLFIQSAQAVAPDFRLSPANAEAVAEVCIRLDGIPLALELAAARVRVLSVGQIVTHLTDAVRLLTGGSRAGPTRQQTLRAALDWSYDLLTDDERALFRRLAVFTGGCDLEAAENLTPPAPLPSQGRGEPDQPWSNLSPPFPAREGGPPERQRRGLGLDLLTRLVDKSLVVMAAEGADARYRLLEPVRQYAGQHLTVRGEEEAVRARHAAHYLALAEQAAPELRGPAQVTWLRRLEREHDNLRAALRWFQERGAAETALRLCVALVPFWDGCGHLSEGRRSLHAALAATASAPAAPRTWALLGAGALAEFQGDLDAAAPLLNACRDLAQAEDDAACVAWATAWLGLLDGSRGEVARARARFEESLERFRALGDQPGIAFALLGLGIAVAYQGDAAPAVVLLEESLALFRSLGDTRYIAIAQTMLGYAVVNTGDAAGAAALVAEGLAGHWEVGDRTYLAYALVVMAGILNRLGQPARAVRLLGAEEALRELLGGPLASATLTQHARLVAALRRQLGPTEFEPAWAGGRAMTLAEAVIDARAATQIPAPAPAAGAIAPAAPARQPLTRREQEVARLLTRGLTDRQIAATLTIAVSTASIHVHNILAKLDFHSRWQVAEWAVAQRLAPARSD